MSGSCRAAWRASDMRGWCHDGSGGAPRGGAEMRVGCSGPRPAGEHGP